MKAMLFSCVLTTALATLGTQAATTTLQAADSAHGIAAPTHRAPEGVVRVWGHPAARAWLEAQAGRFTRRHPGIRIQSQLTGSDVGMAGLYTGQADVVLMGREATESEIKAFEWIFRYRPTAVPILAGSLDKSGQAPALVLFVHKDNPLQSLSLAQLDGIFGTARENGWHDNQPVAAQARGSELDIRRWDQLGLKGSWIGQPIRIYMPMAESGSGKFFRQHVLADSNRMPWNAIREFEDPVLGPEDSGRRILQALSVDRHGIAVSSLQYATPAVRPLRLSVAAHAKPIAAERSSVATGSYPLARTVYAYVNMPPVKQMDSQVEAWLRDVLAEPATRAMDDTGFIPLSASRRKEAMKILPFPKADPDSLRATP